MTGVNLCLTAFGSKDKGLKPWNFLLIKLIKFCLEADVEAQCLLYGAFEAHTYKFEAGSDTGCRYK